MSTLKYGWYRDVEKMPPDPGGGRFGLGTKPYDAAGWEKEDAAYAGSSRGGGYAEASADGWARGGAGKEVGPVKPDPYAGPAGTIVGETGKTRYC